MRFTAMESEPRYWPALLGLNYRAIWQNFVEGRVGVVPSDWSSSQRSRRQASGLCQA